MAKPNVIVDGVRGFSSPIEAAAAVVGEPSARFIEVNFDGGGSGNLELKDRRSVVWADVLDNIRHLNQPVYVEIDPQTNVITEVLVPLSVKVGTITPLDNADVEVELTISQAKHYLKRSNPNFQKLSDSLKKAKDEDENVLVTEAPNTHDIIDVRPNPNPAPAEVIAPQQVSEAPKLVSISLQKAQELFDLVKSRTCCPASAAAPCIPFLYPDDGCWGRAHEMCRLMIAAGVQPDKIWIYGSLKTQATNNPNCIVYWGWHVAPTVQVSGSGILVIDPSLFNGPVTEAAWKGVQGDPSAVLVPTNASVFHRSFSGSVSYDDAAYTRTNQVLNNYRNQLKIRSVSPSGPPPYIKCLTTPIRVQWFGTIGPNSTGRWYTWGWPAQWHVFWTIMPITHCPGGPQLTWTVEVERANETQCTYWITVKNLTGDPVRFEGRYDVLSK